MPQLNYGIGPIPAVPGLIFDMGSVGGDIVSITAGAIIPFGVFCELTAGGLLVPLLDATTGGAFLPQLIGVSVYDPLGVEAGYTPWAVPANTVGSSVAGYPIGASVPVMRRGRIWVAGDGGGTTPKIGSINVWHSSTGANAQGVVTGTAISAVAGAEIDVLPKTCEVYDPHALSGTYTTGFGAAFTIVPMSINLPGRV